MPVPTQVGAEEAARILGVTKPTLYAYVSRGTVTRRTAVDGRTSLYDRDELEGLAARSRRRSPVERPSIDVRIGSAITHLDDDRVTFRGHDVASLARRCTYEQAAELIWTGNLPDGQPRWPLDRTALERAQSVAGAATVGPLARLALAATAASGPDAPSDGAGAARRLATLAPTVLGGPRTGSVASRTARAWLRRPSDAVVAAVDACLVLLADHELAPSTLGVRVAASVRTDPTAALATGLTVVGGRLHGGASRAAAELVTDALRVGAIEAVATRVDAGIRVPGFGHSVYRRGDPRFEPLIERVREIGVTEVVTAVDGIVAEAARRLALLPNIDLGVGALLVAAGLPPDAPLFAVARIAGWGAHIDEELTERPVRFRGLTSPT